MQKPMPVAAALTTGIGFLQILLQISAAQTHGLLKRTIETDCWMRNAGTFRTHTSASRQ
jgi:hypothetical protein